MQFKLLSADQCQAILDFETENRNFFEQHVQPRPNGYYNFSSLKSIINQIETEQISGECFLYLVYQDNKLLGRINLVNIKNGTAELGYRLGERATGKGNATKFVAKIVEIAKTEHQLKKLVARTKNNNLASQRVLTKNNFTIDNLQVNSVASTDDAREFIYFNLAIN